MKKNQQTVHKNVNLKNDKCASPHCQVVIKSIYASEIVHISLRIIGHVYSV